MVFCAYCGKGFTRKEHLERHLPTHTNVKPHRCEDCQLGFSRRDLLQRHHATYHMARDPMEPTPGGAPTTAGRTQIACLNCAQAKTGCDKQTPSCTRCREKGLQCEVRYARRSTKSAYRATQAAKKAPVSMSASHPQPIPAPTAMVPVPMDSDHGASHGDAQVKVPISPTDVPMTMDPRISQNDSSPKRNSPANSHTTPDGLLSPPTVIDTMDDFFQYGSDFMHQDPNFPEMWPWGDMADYDMYPNNPQMQADPISVFPDFNSMASSNSELIDSATGSTHTRSTSIMSSTKDFDPILLDTNSANAPDTPALELGAVLASESGWPIARCNTVTYSGDCPRTAIVHLESLERKSKQDGTWKALEGLLDMSEKDCTDLTSVVPMNTRTRDQILAIAQTFLHKALDIHRSGFQNQNKRYPSSGIAMFLVLPPAKILEYFLRSYVRNLSFFYSLVSSGRVDPNEMISSNQAATLLVLLMIAQGASVVPREEARTLSIGLIETCRISLFDIIEKNVEMCADPTVHRCSLLFTLLGAWSGDKWLMDIAMGQRAMYLAASSFNSPTNIEVAWRSWLDHETKNRLVYNWVMVDQELSLFHDTAPLMAISDLCTPLPGPEELWMSGTADQWMAAMQSINHSASVGPQLVLPPPPLTPSLFSMFQDFLHDNLHSQRWGALTPHKLRLLLHPLQSLLWHLREVIFCLSDTSNPRTTPGSPAEKPPVSMHKVYAQDLLQKWYRLSNIYFKAHPTCVATKTNLVLFHLISLNAVTNFPAIEQLARRERGEGAHEGSSSAWEAYGPHIRAIEEAVYHCGQVIRLVRAMPADRRPIWWSAAVYRALLILWAYSVLRQDPGFLKNPEGAFVLVMDAVELENGDLFDYMWGSGPKAIPVLSGPNGSTVGLGKPSDVLDYAVAMLDEGVSTRFSDGIRRKIIALNHVWSSSS
ncbi:hypothetical protein F5Y12DRAFT_797431 [Xylaria sp. FL1777]|nr:hypothetical protein F5Y12DRAFT_797431 [Xylaria sp. FL1777]